MTAVGILRADATFPTIVVELLRLHEEWSFGNGKDKMRDETAGEVLRVSQPRSSGRADGMWSYHSHRRGTVCIDNF